MTTTPVAFVSASSAATVTVLATVPAGSEFACAVAGVFGGTMLLLATWEVRRPSKSVITADILSSALAGFSTHAFGLAWTLFLISKVMGTLGIPGAETLAQVNVTDNNHINLLLVCAAFSGTMGAAMLRLMISRFYPDWLKPNDKA